MTDSANRVMLCLLIGKHGEEAAKPNADDAFGGRSNVNKIVRLTYPANPNAGDAFHDRLNVHASL